MLILLWCRCCLHFPLQDQALPLELEARTATHSFPLIYKIVNVKKRVSVTVQVTSILVFCCYLLLLFKGIGGRAFMIPQGNFSPFSNIQIEASNILLHILPNWIQWKWNCRKLRFWHQRILNSGTVCLKLLELEFVQLYTLVGVGFNIFRIPST